MRIFLDANIIFSAADPTSATHVLLTAAARQAELVTSPHAWEEASRNLVIKRPQTLTTVEKLKTRVAISRTFARYTLPGLPECDVPILSGAISSQSTHLWTGDRRHFGEWYGKTVHGVLVVSSIQLVNLLRKAGSTI